MKKIIFLLVGLFLSLLFAGCEKDLDPVTPEVVNTPVITVTYTTTDGCVTLNWDIKPAESVFLGTTPVAVKGDTIINIKNDTTFVFTAENKGKKAKESFFIEAKDVILPLPTLILSVSPSTLPVGGGIATISWIANNATIVYYNGIGYGPTSVVATDWIIKDTIINLLAVGPGGSKTFGTSIKVEEPLDPIVIWFGQMIGSWKLSQMMESYNLITITWENVTLFPSDIDNVWTFNEDHTAVIDNGLLRPNNIDRFVNFSNWNLESNSNISGFIGPIRKLSYVDESHLHLIYESDFIVINPDGTSTTTPRLVKEIFIKQ
jgi:hypothetical protein